MKNRFSIRSIRHGSDHPADPVETLGRNFARGVGQIGRGLLHIGVERDHGVERVGGIGDPLHCAQLFRQVGPELDQGHKVVAVDADGAVHAPVVFGAIAGVGIVGRALVVRGQHILDILRGDLLFRHHAPGQIIRLGGVICAGAVPHPGVGVQAAQHIPGAGRIVNMIGVRVAAEGIARVQRAVLRKVQMVLCNELFQICRAQVIFLCTAGIFQIKCIHAKLIGHHHIAVVRHTAGHPVVAADRFQPPDLVHVLERDAVHLIGAVRLQQTAQPLHALAGRVDVRQHQVDDILLPDAAGHFRLSIPRGLVNHQRVRPQHAGIGGDGLGSRHADVGCVDTGRRPDALALHGIGHRRHPQRFPRQRDLHMGQHRAVHRRMLLRLHDHKFFCREMSGAGIVVPGDHR